jgi:hypothetical protein
MTDDGAVLTEDQRIRRRIVQHSDSAYSQLDALDLFRAVILASCEQLPEAY